MSDIERMQELRIDREKVAQRVNEATLAFRSMKHADDISYRAASEAYWLARREYDCAAIAYRDFGHKV